VTDPILCRWCGEPLPPRDPNRRGRPAVTHEGNCRRRDSNRRRMRNRSAAFADRHRFQADRSDYVAAAVQVFDYDEIADGFSPVPDPFAGLTGRAWVDAVERAEKQHQQQREIDRLEWRLAKEELAAQPSAPGILDLIPTEEAEALVARAVAARRARRGE
jgi:hypothetical protein